MKILVPCTLACLVVLSACASAPQGPSAMPLSVPAPAAAAVSAPPASPGPRAAALPAPAVYRYRCQSGETVSASYPTTDLAVVQYRGRQYDMRIAMSGSGARYVGGGLVWWTKGMGPGSDGSLFHHQADGSAGGSVEVCKEV